VLVSGIDATDAVMPFGTRDQSLKNVDVVFTNQITSARGTVVDRSGQPATPCVVLVFPVERDRWYWGSRYFGSVTCSSQGTFGVALLPPGDYYFAAIDRLDGSASAAWQDPEYLERLSRDATRVALIEAQRATVTLTMTR